MPEAPLVTHLWQGYDGTIHVSGFCRMPWHGVDINEEDVQVLPVSLRRFPDARSGG